ncbi:MAG: nucleotidyltransferase family protein [Clostridiales bacterium]|nr:nucleotidyltransferase family protein [Clostridiales bacterium]
MNNNELVLMQLLRSFVNQTPPDIEETAYDRDEVLQLAAIHDVAAIVGHQLLLTAEGKRPEYKHALLQTYAATVMRTGRVSEVQETITALFAEAGIDHLYIKGSAIARNYPMPELRTMGDIDILVRLCDRERAIELLEKHGAARFESSIDVSTYSFNGVMIELHTNMIHEEVQTDFQFRDYFAKAWEHAAQTQTPALWELEPTFHFIYVIAHLAKHFHNRGSGVRMFMDVAILMEKQKEVLDYNRIMHQLNEMHLDRFFARLLYLNKRWFGSRTEIVEEQLSEEAFADITDYVLSGGVFGYRTTPEENVELRKLYHENREGSVKSSAKKLFFQTIFPNRKRLERLGYAPFKRNRKLLTPFVWIYRWAYCLLTKSGDVKTRLQQLSNISDEKVRQIVNQERIVREMGL